jgi:antitoxin (DNA-binding transcriptional repressor) of toxin-antitoxin stability system
MKTATVRDLRNHYSKLLGWIDAGEEVAVSRRGRVIARLVPEGGKKPQRVDWKTSAAYRMDKMALPHLSAAASAALLAESQGER